MAQRQNSGVDEHQRQVFVVINVCHVAVDSARFKGYPVWGSGLERFC